MPLSFAEKGTPQVIRHIGGTPEIKKHLEDLGLNVGGDVTVINVFGDNLIVKVKGSRIALSSELAKKILI